MIPMNGFAREPAELKSAEVEACRRVIESGWYVLGEEGQAFEAEWAAACGTSHAIGVGNGMDALEIALRALGIGPGDEVITTPVTAFATVLAIIRSGATPVLADVDLDTGLLNIDSARRCITARTKAIILVHLYGQLRQIDSWLDLCDTHDVSLIEDCAQAHGARTGARTAGSFGSAGAFSFYPTKNLGAIGDAGALVTNDDQIASLAMQLRNYGQSVRYHHPHLGLNSRLDELQAAILRSRLTWLDQFTERRRTIAEAYRRGITSPHVQHLAEPEEAAAHVYHQFVIRTERRDALMTYLQARDIETLIHYPVAVHQQASVQGIARDPNGLADAEAFTSTCVSIPCHPQLMDEEVATIVAAVNEWGGG